VLGGITHAGHEQQGLVVHLDAVDDLLVDRVPRRRRQLLAALLDLVSDAAQRLGRLDRSLSVCQAVAGLGSPRVDAPHGLAMTRKGSGTRIPSGTPDRHVLTLSLVSVATTACGGRTGPL